MYIPKEVIWFLLGFIFFPLVCVIVYQIKGDKSEEKEEEKK